MPGKENNFDFTVDEPGTYRGQCAELCGTFHGAMLFEVHALPQADFDAWLAGAIEKANATPAPQPSGEAAGPVVEAAAKNVALHHAGRSRAPADTPFTIHFKNDETAAGVLHNVEIKDAAGASLFTRRHHRRRRRRSATPSRRSPRAPTPSSARSIRT